MSGDFKQSANLTGKMLASGQAASAAADVTPYTVPASTAAKLASVSLHNTSAAAVVINKVSIIPSGGTSDGTHQQLTNYTLAAYDTISAEDVLSWLKGAMLGAGDKLVINVGTANVINYLATGAESF